MLKLKEKLIGGVHKKEMLFINPACGHMQTFTYSSPITCQETSCFERVKGVDKLHGDTVYALRERVKYFAESKL